MVSFLGDLDLARAGLLSDAPSSHAQIAAMTGGGTTAGAMTGGATAAGATGGAAATTVGTIVAGMVAAATAATTAAATAVGMHDMVWICLSCQPCLLHLCRVAVVGATRRGGGVAGAARSPTPLECAQVGTVEGANQSANVRSIPRRERCALSSSETCPIPRPSALSRSCSASTAGCAMSLCRRTAKLGRAGKHAHVRAAACHHHYTQRPL